MTGRTIVLTASLVTSSAIGAAAQTAAPVEHLSFDRPEAWALEYFTSVTFLTGVETAIGERAGSIAIGLETGWVPRLSTEQQRVGFSGTAAQDLNKAPLLLRPRVRIGLPGRLAVIVSGTPPIKAFGITPRLLAAGVEWSMIDRPDWRVAWRVHGQTGTVTGAFTCPAGVVAFAPGSAANPTGCQAESSDEVTLRYGSAEVDVSRRFRRLAGLTPHVAVALNDIDSHFQVNALAFGKLDRSELATRGVTTSVTAGAAFPVSSRVSLAADLFYTPLMVRREAGGPRTNDGLFNVRGFLTYRVR
jgi:hypothetical protein